MWDLFHQAVDREECAREAFLEEACVGDDILRRRVGQLLAAHRGEGGILDRPAAPDVATAGIGSAPKSSAANQRGPSGWPGPGEVLANRFQIVRSIGEGGMSVVYAAFDNELGTTVALKLLRVEIARALDSVARFRTEITLARRVTHPNVCRVFDLFRHDDNTVFLTMELLIGETLSGRICRRGPMTTGEALPILESVAAALAAAHEVGVIHRDLKTGNVMLVSQDESLRAVVTDFGLATTSLADPDQAASCRSEPLLGTPAFMAPEQLTGAAVGPATDVYALGLLMYQMLTGRLPVEGDSFYEVAARRLHQEAPSPRVFLPTLDPRWERTILRCLERAPADRLQGPADVVARLRLASR